MGRHKVTKVYVATIASTEAEAVVRLKERVAHFYGEPIGNVGIVITSCEQESSESFSICDTEPVQGSMSYSVEGYGYFIDPATAGMR